VLDRSRLACDLAKEAGALIRDAMGRRRDVEFKSAVDVVTDTDRRAQALIVEGIRRAFPDDAIVAEENDGISVQTRDGAAAVDGYQWFVDPLDGTVNFVHGLPQFAVSIGVFAGGVAEAAAVYDPAKDEMFRAERGGGAFLGDERLAVSDVPVLDRALLVTGFPYDRREHADLYLEYFRKFMLVAQDVRRFGSASLDWKLHPWDTAAGWLVLEEAGGRVTDFDGSAYDPWLPRILATNGRIHDEAVATMATLGRHC
jgi:myo-inositol-1(or 4)-monophosphatase